MAEIRTIPITAERLLAARRAWWDRHPHIGVGDMTLLRAHAAEQGPRLRAKARRG